MPRKIPPAKLRAIELPGITSARLHRRMVPAPIAMMEMIIERWAAQAITAAADLGIADALAKGPLSADELATAVNADADALSRLLRALISRGIFRQRRDGRYDLTPLADTLRRDADVSIAGMGPIGWVRPSTASTGATSPMPIRTGRAVVPVLRGKPFFEYLAVRTANSAKSSIGP